MSHCLDGKTISRIDLATDNKAIKFIVDNGEEIVAKSDGDCCSDSWIEHVELPALGFPAKVLEIEYLDLDDKEEEVDKYSVTKFYGLKIKTDRGDITIDYRNCSNGYYGGNLSWPGDYFYGGVHGQNVSNEEYVILTKDI